MDYSVDNHDNGVRIRLCGQFTFVDNQKFRQIVDLCQQQEAGSLELDFAGVDFIDSAGLGMLLLLRDTCQNRSLPLSLHAAHGQVEKIFSISKFDQLFSIAS